MGGSGSVMGQVSAALPGGMSNQAAYEAGRGTKQSHSEKLLEQAALARLNVSDPLHNAFIGRGLGLMQGTQNVTDLPEYSMLTNAANRALGDQYGMAQRQIMENTPVGATGVMQRGLQNAAIGQAEQRGGIANQIANQLFQMYIQNALSSADNYLQAGMSGLGANVAGFASRYGADRNFMGQYANASGQYHASVQDSIADMIGGIMGAKGGGGGK